MPQTVDVEFAALADFQVQTGAPRPDTLVVFAGEGAALSAATRKLLGAAAENLPRAAGVAKFKGKTSTAMDILAPGDLTIGRLIVVGDTPARKPAPGAPEIDYALLGGYVMGKANGAANILIALDPSDWKADPAQAAADFMMGVKLRAYTFDRYKSKKKDKDKDEEQKPDNVKVTIGVADPEAARRAASRRDAIANGVRFARDLVNEPPNVLFPVEFANRCRTLEKFDVEVEILDVEQMKALGMNTLLGVGQGSAHESRTVIMRWNGGKKDEKPVAFVGKGEIGRAHV